MSDSEKDRERVISELKIALQELSTNNLLPLREKALVLEAIEHIEREEHESTARS